MVSLQRKPIVEQIYKLVDFLVKQPISFVCLGLDYHRVICSVRKRNFYKRLLLVIKKKTCIYYFAEKNLCNCDVCLGPCGMQVESVV